MEAGPFIWPIILLTLLIGVLFLWNAVLLLVRPTTSTASRHKSIDSVLFWGGVAAVLGLLGQWMGIHKLTRVIHEQGVVSPPMVAYGISESLLTPLAGMVVLVGAGILWSLLRLRLWSVERRVPRSAS
jgi:uncharacterized membrane protein YjfL (UPF0719 family)